MEIMEDMFGLNFEYQYIRNDGRVLGLTVFNSAFVPVYDEEYKQYELIRVQGNTVIIDAHLFDQKMDGRFRYTCAHELGHYVRHKEFYLAEDVQAAKSGEVEWSTEEDTSAEWQADYFGCCLLMPKGVVKKAFYRTTGDKIIALANLFRVSQQSMRIRLKEIGLQS
jgi:Zn-dependent peptidase ImmA (M78 family)